MIDSLEPFAGPGAPYLVARGDDWAVLYKPAGMHSVKGRGEGRTLEDFATEAGFRFLMSRLDFDTSGLVLCALNEGSQNRFARAQEGSGLSKGYRLRCSRGGQPLQGSIPGLYPRYAADAAGAGRTFPVPGFTIEGRFRPFGADGARVACIATDEAVRCRKPLAPGIYRTRITAVDERTDGAIEAEVEIAKGFRHQIRAHFAWCGFPILGDARYGGARADRLFLESCRIGFPDTNGIPLGISLYAPLRPRVSRPRRSENGEA